MNKQDEVQKYLVTVEQATKQEIYKNVPFGYYCNEMKHIGALLSKMVDNGKIERLKPGVFRNKEFRSGKTEKVDADQISMFKI